MIHKNEIDEMSVQLGVHSSHVQRDYVHGWLLSLIYSSSSLADRIVLKGGNGLRKGYFEHCRYSRDLDFSTTVGISEEELARELNNVCAIVNERASIVFNISRTRVEEKKRADSDKKISEARLYFKDFYGAESEIVLAIKMDVTQFDRIYLPVQERKMIHPYSDHEKCSTKIKCVKLEEIMATKMRCLLQRKHIADLYDLMYTSMISSDIELNKSELISTFFNITIFGSNPSVAKGLFIDLPMEAFGRLWKKYITCPSLGWFEFDKAKNSFFEFIHALIPGREERQYSSVFFPSSLRNPILQAADSLTLLKITYDGVERLVEPYELTFKIRRDGVAREYLYVYDTEGGRTSGPGIKTFVSEKVQDISNTVESFEPRFDVDLNKAGGAETVSRFEGRRGSRGYKPFPSRKTVKRQKSGERNYSVGWGIEYQVECPYCNKRFKRKTYDTKLNPHKDRFGNSCYGKVGYII